MIPVFMPHTHHIPDQGVFGQCFRACVASIFDLTLHDVPHFTNEWMHKEGLNPQEGMEQRLREWLEPQGLEYLVFRVPMSDMEQAINGFETTRMGAHHIMGGLSKLGLPHNVVGRFGRVVHDPWPILDDPHRGILLPDETIDGFELGFFVKR